MTINDEELNRFAVEIHRAASRLDHLMREGKNHGLLIEFAKIQHAAQKAGWRLIELEAK